VPELRRHQKGKDGRLYGKSSKKRGDAGRKGGERTEVSFSGGSEEQFSKKNRFCRSVRVFTG